MREPTTYSQYMAGVIPWELTASECPRCESSNYRHADPPMPSENHYCRACGYFWHPDDAQMEEEDDTRAKEALCQRKVLTL